MSFLRCNEVILFTGTYDTANRNVTANISTLPCNIEANPEGFNIRTAQYYYTNEKGSSEQFLLETYDLSSYKSDLKTKVGEIVWNGLYPDPSSQQGITTGGIQRFVVFGKSGIYKNVITVVIDFKSPIRTIYFLGKCENIF